VRTTNIFKKPLLGNLIFSFARSSEFSQNIIRVQVDNISQNKYQAPYNELRSKEPLNPYIKFDENTVTINPSIKGIKYQGKKYDKEGYFMRTLI